MLGEPPVRADGRHRAVAAAVAALVLVASAGSLLLDRQTAETADARSVLAPTTPVSTAVPGPVPTSSVDPTVLRVQALDELLEARAAAILDRDLDAWMATIDPSSPAFAEEQAAVFANLRDVPLADWEYEYAGDGPMLTLRRAAELGGDAWVARTVLAYRLADAGGEVRRQHDLTLVRRGEQWLVAGSSDGATAPDLWDLGAVQVVRGSRSLVLGTVTEDALQRFAAETDEAAAGVDAVWGQGWPRTVVVLVPSSQTEMARLLQRADEAGLEQIAAVTTGEVGLERFATAADRVVVNPAGFDRLGPLGRQVVLRHEITHVATRTTTAHAVPIWLSEGFADYVAYRGSGVSRAVVAQDVLERVRAGQAPRALPTQVDFDAARGDIAPAYAAAWLAADLVEQRWGEPALVELYRTVAAGGTTREALPQVLGLDEAAFTREWRAYLEELAS